MGYISEYIDRKLASDQKILSVFLTLGFPNIKEFTDLAIDILDAGADMLEIGIPFSDPVADGKTIQHSSQVALKESITMDLAFEVCSTIKSKLDKPLILMSYANPVYNYGTKQLFEDASSSGISGIIVPDVPLEEHKYFFENTSNKIEKILLASPTTSEDRMKQIDNLSEGFVYYVSMTGTTGEKIKIGSEITEPLKRAAKVITKNKVLLGFGISSPDNIRLINNYVSGFIVGSAVIRSIMGEQKPYSKTINLVSNLKSAL